MAGPAPMDQATTQAHLTHILGGPRSGVAFRVVSDADYQRMKTTGTVDSAGHRNLEMEERGARGMAVSPGGPDLRYLDDGKPSRVLALAVKPDEVVHYNPWDAAVTKPLGTDRIVAVSPTITRRGQQFVMGDAKGDTPGHEFHGNQYTGGIGSDTPRINDTPANIAEQGSTDAKGTPDDPIYCGTDVPHAATLLAEGKSIRMADDKTVSILVDKLGSYAKTLESAGKRAPDFNLCNVSVASTNVFCGDNKGYPRVEMPQLKGWTVAGSTAAGMRTTDDPHEEVDVSGQFMKQLQANGVSVVEKDVPENMLRATQNELLGGKVGEIMQAMRAGTLAPGDIWTTKDGYILDGHHRWAATLANDLNDGKAGDDTIRVREIGMEIGQAIDEARTFGDTMGIARAVGVVGKKSAPCCEGCGETKVWSAEWWFKGDVPGHEFHGNQWTEGQGSSQERNLAIARRRAVYDYTLPEKGRQLNADLRNNPGVPSWVEAQVKLIDAEIALHATSAPSVAFRGMVSDHEFQVGEKFRDKGYVSVAHPTEPGTKAEAEARKSAELFAAGDFGRGGEGLPRNESGQVTVPVGQRTWLAEVHLPAGQHYAPGAEEVQEMILPRGTQFRVTDVGPEVADAPRRLSLEVVK